MNKIIQTTIQDLDNKLSNIRSKISFTDVNPININHEKEKFFTCPNYNPQFAYRENSKYEDILRELKAMQVPDCEFKNIFNTQIEEYMRESDMLQKVGSKDFTVASLKRFGYPKIELLLKSKDIVEQQKIDLTSVELLDTDEIIGRFNSTLSNHGFGWKIIEKDMVAGAAVSASAKILYIRKGLTCTIDFLKKLVIHEFGTHVLRAENGSVQPLRIFHRGFPGYLSTEEGLAVWNEYATGVQNFLRIYAGRTLAIDLALNNSFKETYDGLTDYFSKEESWRLTVRAKRGLSDTSLSGACTKDYVYLHGYFKIMEFIESGGDLSELYFGKIGIEHIDISKRLCTEPKFLPSTLIKA